MPLGGSAAAAAPTAAFTKPSDWGSGWSRDYNAVIPPDGSVTFRFLGNGPGSPLNCTFNDAACTGETPGGLGAPGTPTVTGRTGSSLTLSWTAGSGTPTGYRVYEGSDRGRP